MTLEREEEVLMLAIRDILMPRLSQKHVLLLQQLFKTHYPAVNFSRFTSVAVFSSISDYCDSKTLKEIDL